MLIPLSGLAVETWKCGVAHPRLLSESLAGARRPGSLGAGRQRRGNRFGLPPVALRAALTIVPADPQSGASGTSRLGMLGLAGIDHPERETLTP